MSLIRCEKPLEDAETVQNIILKTPENHAEVKFGYSDEANDRIVYNQQR